MTSPQRRRVRRRPRMVPFLVTGALIGLAIALALAILGPAALSASRGQEIMALGVPGVLLGGLAGGIVFLAMERLSGRS